MSRCGVSAVPNLFGVSGALVNNSRSRSGGRWLRAILLGAVTCATLVVAQPVDRAAASTFNIQVRFYIGIANLQVSLCGGPTTTITNPNPSAAGPFFVSSTVTRSSNFVCSNTTITENAAAGYFLPGGSFASLNSPLCNATCTPNNTTNRASNLTTQTWSGIRSSDPGGYGWYYWVDDAGGTASSTPPAVNAAASINDTTPSNSTNPAGNTSFWGYLGC